MKKRGGTIEYTYRDLIISSGDASDYDGFMALKLYYRVALEKNLDVAFVMNYPAYFSTEAKKKQVGPVEQFTYTFPHDPKKIYPFHNNALELGKGFDYDYQIFKNARTQRLEDSVYDGCNKEILTKLKTYFDQYHINDENEIKEKFNNMNNADNERLSEKYYLTVIAKYIADKIWEACSNDFKSTEGFVPKLYFCIGGTNTFNPFSAEKIKDEIVVYGHLLENVLEETNSDKKIAFLKKCKDVHKLENFIDKITKKNKIYIDMNGSAAWYTSSISDKIKDRVQGVFVMGGVLNYSQVNTLGAMDFLNRLSCATMNQLYHGENTERLFTDFENKLYFVSNNEINANFSFANKHETTFPKNYTNNNTTYIYTAKETVQPDQTKKISTGITKKNTTRITVEFDDEFYYNHFKEIMLGANLISGNDLAFTERAFEAFYKKRPGDRKPFDVISSLALVHFIYNPNIYDSIKKSTLLFDKIYGVTILSNDTITGDKTAQKMKILQTYFDIAYNGKQPIGFLPSEKEKVQSCLCSIEEKKEEECFLTKTKIYQVFSLFNNYPKAIVTEVNKKDINLNDDQTPDQIFAPSCFRYSDQYISCIRDYLKSDRRNLTFTAPFTPLFGNTFSLIIAPPPTKPCKSSGGNNSTYKKSRDKILLGKVERCVYLDNKRAKFVKLNGRYVSVKAARLEFKKKK